MKKLHKSSIDKKFTGVCGGIAEYLGIDSTLVRLIIVVTALWGGIGFWVYLVCMFVMPDSGITVEDDYKSDDVYRGNDN